MSQATQSTDAFQTTLSTIMRVAKVLDNKNQTLPKKLAFRLVKRAILERKSQDEQWIKEQILLESKLGNTITHTPSKQKNDVMVKKPIENAKNPRKTQASSPKAKNPRKTQATPQKKQKSKKTQKKFKQPCFKPYKEPFIQFNKTYYKTFCDVFGEDSFDFMQKNLKDMHQLNPYWASKFMGTVQALNYQIPANSNVYTYITTHKEWKVSGLTAKKAYTKALNERKRYLREKWEEKQKKPSFEPRKS